MENYIVINGKKAELTEEQLRALGIEAVKLDPFAMVEDKKPYYFIASRGYVDRAYEHKFDYASEDRYKCANYCSDENMMLQQLHHETLNRLLWRFSMQNGGDDLGSDKYYIAADNFPGQWNVYVHSGVQAIGLVYFKTHDLADQAIYDIIKPFVKAHPDFKP